MRWARRRLRRGNRGLGQHGSALRAQRTPARAARGRGAACSGDETRDPDRAVRRPARSRLLDISGETGGNPGRAKRDRLVPSQDLLVGIELAAPGARDQLAVVGWPVLHRACKQRARRTGSRADDRRRSGGARPRAGRAPPSRGARAGGSPPWAPCCRKLALPSADLAVRQLGCPAVPDESPLRCQRPTLPPADAIEHYFSLSREHRWFSNHGPGWDLLRSRLTAATGARPRADPQLLAGPK